MSFAQLVVDESVPLNSIIQGLEGEGVIISNITSSFQSGAFPVAAQFKQFKGGFLGLEEGLLLTTGAARLARGPNNAPDITQENSPFPMFDIDLDQIEETNQQLYDIAIVEFDVTVSSSSLTFNYVFGSEEYIEYVNQNFNDVFGFFISGPGISGKQNLATLNGDPVSIDNINHLQNEEFFVPNGVGDAPQFFRNLQYDGYTTVLEAKAVVIPCETYHIKLAIADVGDQYFDSGVFIETGSFNSQEPPLITYDYDKEGVDFLVENCNGVVVTVTRSEQDQNIMDQSISYDVIVTGSATEEVDYTAIPESIVIPPGQLSVSFRIDAFQDNIEEVIETLTIGFLSQCDLFPNLVEETISLANYLPFEFPKLDACVGDIIELNSNYDGPDSLVWDANDALSCTNCPNPVTNVTETSYFPYTIVNENGCISRDSVYVLAGNPIAFFNYDKNDNYSSLDAFFDNLSQNADQYSWDFGDGQGTQDEDPFHQYALFNSGEEWIFKVTLKASSDYPMCESVYDTTIIINNPLFIPNIITPNDDRKNEKFVVNGITLGVWELEIFNRWGERVYRSSGYSNDWEAAGMSDGLYYYELENPNKDRFYKGWVEVLR